MLRAGAKDVIPVSAFDWRPKPLEWHAEFFRERSVAFCEAIARSIGVRGAAEECARERRHGYEQRLERRDRARPHAPAACRVERIGARTLDGGDAQSVNRGFGENEPREGLSRWGQAEERLGAACERAFVGRPANIDVGDGTRAVEMSEPGAAGRALPQDAGRGSRLDDRRWKEALPGEIAPGRRIRPHGLPIGPTFGDGSVRGFAAPCPFGDRKARLEACKFAQALADMTEVGRRLQPLDQTEHIALGVAGGIPPAFAAVADDQDLALATPVFQAELRALLPVERPWRRRALEHDGAMHLIAQVFDFQVAHGRSLRLRAGARLLGLGLLFAPALPADREAGALQGRAERAGAPRRTLVGAAGASGSHPFLLRSPGEGSEAMARTGNPCRGRGPPDQWPVEGRWLGNIYLTGGHVGARHLQLDDAV